MELFFRTADLRLSNSEKSPRLHNLRQYYAIKLENLIQRNSNSTSTTASATVIPKTEPKSSMLAHWFCAKHPVGDPRLNDNTSCIISQMCERTPKPGALRSQLRRHRFALQSFSQPKLRLKAPSRPLEWSSIDLLGLTHVETARRLFRAHLEGLRFHRPRPRLRRSRHWFDMKAEPLSLRDELRSRAGCRPAFQNPPPARVVLQGIVQDRGLYPSGRPEEIGACRKRFSRVRLRCDSQHFHALLTF